MKPLLIALLLAPSAWAATTSAAKNMNTFECLSPAGWSRRPNADGSLVLIGPADIHDVSALITVRYYPPGHPDFPSFEAFLARQAAPPVFKSSPPTETLPGAVVAGRKARFFARNASEFVPPRSLNTKEVLMREEFAAVPASKGFYLLTYYAPKSLHQKNRRAFEAVLKSFKPKL